MDKFDRNGVPTHPTYEDVHYACYTASQYVNRPELVVGLVRGGLIPAVIISHALGVSMEAINYSSTRGAGDNVGSHTNELPKLDVGRILIVDDIVDTGYTLQEVVNEYESRGHEVTTFSLYWKESAVIVPNYFWQQIPNDFPWIVYPWEV